MHESTLWKNAAARLAVCLAALWVGAALAAHANEDRIQPYENNTWYSVTEDKPFWVGRRDSQSALSFEEWVEASGERGAEYREIGYPDADRSVLVNVLT